MKKRIVAILLALMLVVSLAACGTVTTPTRGAWDEHVFTSEYLGLRFVLPLNWAVTSDAEIAAAMGIAADFMGDAGVEIPDDLDQFHDMVANNLMTGSSVQIMFERHGGLLGLFTPSRSDVIEGMTETLAEIGGRVTADIPGTTRIGAYDWYSFDAELDMMGMTIPSRQFFSIHEGYIRFISITIMDDSETVEDILANFIGLDDPIPEPPQPERAEALFGTWAWDMDDDYTYLFNADGTGIRGFSGDLEPFEWSTEGDHLMIGFESWTFTIEGDVLTIDSLDITGVTWSYIRQ